MYGFGKADYQEHREDSARRSRARSASGRDIAPGWPGWGDLTRRETCRANLRLFLETYFPAAFFLPFCPDHLRVIEALQEAVLRGGLFALAMPRGYGKSTLCKRTMLWAVLFGHRRFGCIIGATERDSRTTLREIRAELLNNDMLAGDFPDACYPFRATNGQPRLCGGQIWDGVKTDLEIAQDALTFGSIPPADEMGVSGNVITVRPIMGSIRGQSTTLRNGTILRPDFVLLDDPQTRESAKSLLATEDREKIILGDVLGLAGGTTSITAAMTCTVIYKRDLADRFLDRTAHPEWNGIRTRMVYSFPSDAALWDEYRAIRVSGILEGRGIRESNEFYRERREAMDSGAVIAWPENYPPECLSAIQYAMDLRILDEAAFQAERQNEPLDVGSEDVFLAPEIVMAKANSLDRGIAPLKSRHVTAFIDVHDRLLYWLVAAWTETFSGQIVDYGTYPRQPLVYFSQSSAPISMASISPGLTDDAYIAAGLAAVSEGLLSRRFAREDGMAMSVEKLLIDAHWGQKTDLVKSFCLRHPNAGRIVLPSFGVGVGARSRPWDDYSPKPGSQSGHRWRIVPEPGGGRHVVIDSNYWKSFVSSRLAMPLATEGGLELFSDPRGRHVLLADHLCAEKPVRVTAKGREVIEWDWTPSSGDNHWLDCLVGCAVGASIVGCSVPGIEPPIPKRRPTLQELARQGRS